MTRPLDRRTFLPLMLEHLAGEGEYDAARDHLLAAGDRLGLRFE